MANFFHAEPFGNSKEDDVDERTGLPVNGSGSSKRSDVPAAVRALMGGERDRGNHELDAVVTDIRLQWLISEMNNECKQFQEMVYPYCLLWVHDASALHVDCGSMLATLKAISWHNNDNKTGQANQNRTHSCQCQPVKLYNFSVEIKVKSV